MRGEAWIACTLDGTRSLYAVTATGHVDYPIRYPWGAIAYDRPEAIPLRVRRWVERALTV